MIFLIRHGETEWNAAGRKQGLDDSPLTDRGQAQAHAYARVIKAQIEKHKINKEDVHLYISPLGRTQTTARPLIESLELPPESIHLETRLIEYDYGKWSGLTNEQIEQQYPGELSKREQNKWNYTVPNGESYRDIEKKITSWLNDLSINKTNIAITHSVVSRVLRGKHLSLSNQEAGELEHDQDSIFVLKKQAVEMITVS